MELTITLEADCLSDGSYVYNVNLDGTCFSALSRLDASRLADKLKANIDQHTCDTVTINETHAFVTVD